MKIQQNTLLKDSDLDEYRIGGSNEDWEKALKVSFSSSLSNYIQKNSGGLISIPSNRKREKTEVKLDDPSGKKKKQMKKKGGKH